jgi:hypothetical protein
MSQDNAKLAEAISLPDAPAVVILPKEGYDEMVARVKKLEENQEILFGLFNKLKQSRSNPFNGNPAAVCLKAILSVCSYANGRVLCI